MFGWLRNLGSDSKGLSEMHARFLEMIDDGRHVFDAAANGLLGDMDPEVIRKDLFDTDRRINNTEQQIRRDIVVHGTVHGAGTFPALLVMMSLVKDAERIGDYGKNIFDLLAAGVAFKEGEERSSLIELKDEISKLLVRSHGLFNSQDSAGAREFLECASGLEDRCDLAVDRLLAVEGENVSGAILTYRYFKRVISHSSNIITSIVVPLHKLDYFDESPRPSHGDS